MRITVAMLRNAGACQHQVARFAAEWPKGACVDADTVIRAFQLGLDVDWAAVHLLAPPARDAYYKAVATASDAYDKAVATASDAYDKAKATASDAYDKAVATAKDAYYKAEARAWDAYDKAKATASDAYEKAIATAFVSACAVHDAQRIAKATK